MDVTTATFEQEVLEASKRLPVVVDFWAPWCSPCRTLGPTIEKVAADYVGRVKLVKVNTDENDDIAAVFNIRSIPNVIAFRNGRPVAQFIGAQPESQVRAFFERLLPSEAERLLAQAEQLLAEGRLDDAEKVLSAIKSAPELAEQIDALRLRIQYARLGASGEDEAALRERLAANPADHDARLALAGLLAAARRYRDAMEQLVEIVRRDRNWRDGEAKRQLLGLFTLASDDPQLVSEYRRKLGSALH